MICLMNIFFFLLAVLSPDYIWGRHTTQSNVCVAVWFIIYWEVTFSITPTFINTRIKWIKLLEILNGLPSTKKCTFVTPSLYFSAHLYRLQSAPVIAWREYWHTEQKIFQLHFFLLSVMLPLFPSPPLFLPQLAAACRFLFIIFFFS